MSAASSMSPLRVCGPRFGRAPSMRSMMFDRATPSVAAIVFTGNLPEPKSATARSVFCPREIERLLEDLDLHGLAPEQPLAHALLQPAHLGSSRHVVIGADRLLAPFAHQPPPAKHEARAKRVAPCNIADRHPRLQRLGDHGQLLLRREPPPAGHTGNHFDLRERVGHRQMARLIPRPSG